MRACLWELGEGRDQDSNLDKTFQNMKDDISIKTKEKYYIENKEITLQAAASQEAIGAALLQEGSPVTYTSIASNAP